jgi:hypothetical protein
LFQPGSAGDSFVVVLEGQLELVRERDGATTVLKVTQVGEQLGYVSMICLFDRFGIGRGRGATIVLEVNSDLYYQFHIELPLDFDILMLNLSRDMARTIHTIATTGTQAAIDFGICRAAEVSSTKSSPTSKLQGGNQSADGGAMSALWGTR